MKIKVNQLRLQAHIGVSAQEQADPQEIIVSVCVSVPYKKSFRDDDISKTLDYRKIAQVIGAVVKAKNYRLIETLATDCLQQLRTLDDGIEDIKIEIEKTMTKAFRYAKSVSVVLTLKETQ